MFPILRLGPWEVPTYSVVYFSLIVVVGMIVFHRLRRLGGSPQGLLTSLFLLVVIGFAGTYLLGVLTNTLLNLLHGEVALGWKPTFVGTLVFGVLVALWRTRKAGVSLGKALDLGGPPWALLLGLGRIGCLAAGCCGGKTTASWCALYLPDVYGMWAMRYPTQIISGLANIGIFALLMGIERHAQRSGKGLPFDGYLFALYMALFCLERFIMEWLRYDTQPLWGPLTWIHLYTAAGFVAAVALIAWKVRHGRAVHPAVAQEGR